MRSQANRRRTASPRISRRWTIPRGPLLVSLRRAVGAAVVMVALVATAAMLLPRAFRWLVDNPYFAIESVDVFTARYGVRTRESLGDTRLSVEEIERWAGVPLGTSIFRIDPGVIERRLESNSLVRAATVRRLPPRRIRIDVRERLPIALVRLDGLYFVDRRGGLMGRVVSDELPDLPIVSGLENGHGRTSLEVALPRAVYLLRRNRGASLLGPVSEIHFDEEHGATMFPVDVHVSLALGWTGWQKRLERARRVLAAWSGRESHLAAIDLTAPDSVVIRTRDTPNVPVEDRWDGRKTRV